MLVFFIMPHREPTSPGEIYHIYNRGVDKRKIFLNEQDYLRFILSLYILNDRNNKYDIWSSLKFNKRETLAIFRKEATTGSPEHPVVVDMRDKLVDVLAFTLMSNHYHIILRERGDNNIRKFMQKIGAGYAEYFNEQNERSGTLFESRYKDVRIKTDSQLIIIFNYVHTNPVELVEPEWKTNGVQNIEKALKQQDTYLGTSYHDYVGNSKFPLVTDRDFYLDLLGGPSGCRESVEDWIKFKAEMAELPDYLEKV